MSFFVLLLSECVLSILVTRITHGVSGVTFWSFSPGSVALWSDFVTQESDSYKWVTCTINFLLRGLFGQAWCFSCYFYTMCSLSAQLVKKPNCQCCFGQFITYTYWYKQPQKKTFKTFIKRQGEHSNVQFISLCY